MIEKHNDVNMIFLEAVEKQTSEERKAYLDEICRNDTTLRTELESLLRAHEKAVGFLESPVFQPKITLSSSPISEIPGMTIGRYKLLEKIGEGGMAVVYMAEQEEPIHRKVALKIIKLGMDTRQVIARFEAERQALAMMDHPNIAKVLDAGATETGRPYFVMELVTGVSITEYCDKNNLNTKQRLELFIQVCNAVQHAHQKGIIHRDIKPSNIMVTHQDGKAVPKVIDFGIAKAINQKLTEKTLFTRYAHIIGTPAYMSPEQAELSDLDIDTRSDIYSLGVLLYELLIGTTPFSEEELRKVGYIEMQRLIREQEPVRPSTKLSTLGGTLTDIAKHRSATPELLTKSVRGDLDWIVMKSLEKDRGRRYETANSLVLDIRHHLDHEPVMARGPSTTYRLQKFLRRHRSQTIAALALLVIACAGAIILSMWHKDRLQLDEAEGFRHKGILSQAREKYAKAERDAALETIQPILRSRHVGPEAQLLHAGILVDNRRSDEAIAILTDLLDKPQEIAGAAHSLLARILYESESPDAEKLKQIEQHRQKAEALLPETAEAYFLRAMTAITIKEQLASLDAALQLDPAHYESRRLRAFTFYASRKYERLRDDALVMTILRPRDPLGYSLRAMALRELEKYTEAIVEYDNALALTAKTSPESVDLSMQRCETLLRMGDYKRLITEAQGYLKLSPDKPVFQYYIFCALAALGDYDKANTVFREIVGRTPTSRNEFQNWCTKYIFDTLEARRSWHPQTSKPSGAAFLPMVEAEETYRELSVKGHRLTTDGFSPRWSPDGNKLAFSAGVHGRSGVAIFDPTTKETDLLVVPGKDPMWSPDGKYIAFVRDCQLLRLEEMTTAEQGRQQRPVTDEEVWMMKADGTEPRRLVRGGWPSWSRDSTRVYYHSRVDNALCSISIDRRSAEPKRIMKCSHEYPTLSPDEKRVAYIQGASLKVRDLTSRSLVAEWLIPIATWGSIAWSPTGQELCLSGARNFEDRRGLWIYSFDKPLPARVLTGRIATASWSPDATKLVFRLGSAHLEFWSVDLNPNIPTTEALCPAKTIGEHYREMLALYTRRIEADPQDAYAYSSRAHYYDCLHEREKATADMRRWSAIISGSDLQATTTQNIRRILNGPFGYQFVFSAERPVNKIPLLDIAFGQKGRCNMKSFQIPMLSMSLLGFCLLSGLDVPPAYGDFTFGEPVNLKSTIPVIDPMHESIDCFSSDGQEIYIESDRPGGFGAFDLWVLRRASTDDGWDPPENLGSAVNSPRIDGAVSISSDGLTLFFYSNRDGGQGGMDIYMTNRVTRNDKWGQAVNMGPPVNSPTGETGPFISSDGLEFYFNSRRTGGYGGADLYVSKRETTNDVWGEPVNLGPLVNSAYTELGACLSPDGLLLLFSDYQDEMPRPGGYGNSDMWMTRRASRSDPWQTPVNLGPMVNGLAHDIIPRLSPDGSTLYFSNYSGDTWENWQAPIVPICDFDGDGLVDIVDVGIMIEHWYTDDPLCDIGPFPWGDGFVDAQDLKVLAEHLFEEENSLAEPGR